MVEATHASSLDAYALGYCIANFPIDVLWDVRLKGVGHHSFTRGLNSNTPSMGNITKLHVRDSPLNFAELKSNPLNATVSLNLVSCQLTDSDMLHLAELIPHLPLLKILSINDNCVVVDGEEDGLLKVLHQLYYSKVTELGILNTGLEVLFDSPHNCAIEQLIHPLSGTLQGLDVGHDGDYEDINDGKLAALVSAPSSLNKLVLGIGNLSPYALHLKNNTCLTILFLYCANLSAMVSDVVDIVAHNKTLQGLGLYEFSNGESDIDDVRLVVRAIRESTTLQHVQLFIAGIGETNEAVSAYMKTIHEDLTLDYRINFCYRDN